MTWPIDYLEEWKRRARIKNRCLDNVQQCVKLDRFYATHPIQWIEDWCITYDPRRRGCKILPFRLFNRQKEFIQFLYDCYKQRESGISDKARDMGETWLCCAFSVWLWKYEPGVSVGWGSRKRDLVDTLADPDSIFEKMRMIIMRLPEYQLPENFQPDVHMTSMKIVNPETGATITGESGDSIGRGGRKSIYFKDEAAHYEHPEKIEAALGDNTDVQMDISSVNGSNNPFSRRLDAAEIWIPGVEIKKGKVRRFIFDWRDHPGKSQEWYDLRRKKYEDEGLLHIFAQEVDRDRNASQERIIINGEWVRAAIDAHIVLGFEGDGEKIAGQDVADDGGDKNALAIRSGVVLRFINDWGGDAGEAFRIAYPICAEKGISALNYDSIGVGTAYREAASNMQKALREDNRDLPFKMVAWNAGSEVIDPDKPIIPNDNKAPKNKDQYANLKAQAWFRTRARFYKTFRAVRHGEKFPTSELISLDSTTPKVQLLISQLSQATHDYNSKGKTLVDKKPDGALSPNLADALVICYNPIRSPLGFFS